MSYLIRRVLAKPRLILDEMCRLYGKFASYIRRVLFSSYKWPYLFVMQCLYVENRKMENMMNKNKNAALQKNGYTSF